jgi:molybdopterin-guanine dinucleotide biosynthesis protein A
VSNAAGIVLAGGRSTRMRTPKAALEWGGSTLLRRTTDTLARAVRGPIAVVRAPGQPLPTLGSGVEVYDDPREGLGPLQGLAVGLAAVGDRAETAFVSSVDLPFLHVAFVRRVLAAFAELTAVDDVDVVLPHAHGHLQPLAAGYRTSLAPVVDRLVAERQLRPAYLFAVCRVRRLDAAALLADAALAAADPELTSLLNVNTPEDYRAARALHGR